jgi:hypothetical protein
MEKINTYAGAFFYVFQKPSKQETTNRPDGIRKEIYDYIMQGFHATSNLQLTTYNSCLIALIIIKNYAFYLILK